ncbi:MAG: ComC/BlpC family leader-containing pheromone/bacteriocin [Bacteroidales bacterium]|nr:ComC/BlpC family leader-containing pheromone/bacteriocin [Bacteroidales bacterium]
MKTLVKKMRNFYILKTKELVKIKGGESIPVGNDFD